MHAIEEHNLIVRKAGRPPQNPDEKLVKPGYQKNYNHTVLKAKRDAHRLAIDYRPKKPGRPIKDIEYTENRKQYRSKCDHSVLTPKQEAINASPKYQPNRRGRPLTDNPLINKYFFRQHWRSIRKHNIIEKRNR